MSTRAVPLIALVLAGCGGSHDPRRLARDEVLVTVVASGRSEATPDEARFSAGVSSIAATGPAAGAANAQAMNRVIASLAALGIDAKDIQTERLSIARIDYGPNRNRFEASNVVAVRVRQVDRAGAAISAATGAGANVLSGPDLRVSDPEAAARSAYAGAFTAARARAEAYAAAAGLKVTRVLTIDDGAAPSPSSVYSDLVMEQRAPAPVVAAPVLAGTNTNGALVRVSFALAPK